ncbi:MAG TPA: efflux transporter outer membrane subunit [Terracidiphilus sp.]|nr:efflux transporter outer membrane subunit [Terracidiphilus sp.]
MFTPRRASSYAALAAAVCLTGCKPVGPNYVRPQVTAPAAYSESGGADALTPPPNPTGGSWQPASPSDGMLRGDWWKIYNDPELNRLEALVTPNNLNLRASTQLYLAARDAVTAARAQFYPTLSADVSTSHSKLSAHRPLSNTPSASTNFNDLVLAGQAGWEPDFWGRIRRKVEAARASAQASAADAAALDLAFHAELAQDYFELRGLDAQSSLLQATVTDYESQLDLTQKLLTSGIGTEVDVAQARTQLQTLRAQLIDIDQSRAQYRHAIATLIDLEAGQLTLQPAPLHGVPPQIPLGIPSELIERRPDVAAAERRVAQANAQIGIAVSAFYPNISLGAAGGFESTHGGTWIQGPSSLWSLGGQAAELLFDAGERHALSSQARHLYEAQAATYKATVLAAFNEVEDRLSDLRVLEQESAAEQLAVGDAQHSLALSNQRYQGGVASYLEVLTAENALLQNQRTLTDLETRRYAASVGLVRALGGGWDVTQLPK